jgi:GT2 family glycosyltransferase
MTPACSIVIPVYNHAYLTRQCLNTLLTCPSDSIATEIIVVDDASTDLTPEVLATFGSAIRVITHATNLGFAHSVNDGIDAASGTFIVFLNNDVMPVPGWLDALVAYADEHPEAAIVGSKLLFPDDTIQHAGVIFTPEGWPRHIYAGFPADHPAVNKSRRFQAVTAACALVRREVLLAVGGFDTAFRNGAEDVDLCLRLGEHGYEAHYCHTSVLYHLESASRRGQHDEFNHNARLLASRWGNRVRPDDIQYYIEDGLLRFDYGNVDTYPLRAVISPLLAIGAGDETERQVDEQLARRAHQVLMLQQENVRLTLQINEGEFERQMRAALKGDA